MHTPLSLKAAYEERLRLEAQAKKVWEGLADQLVERIPSDLRKFADEHAWYKFQTGDVLYWKLPEFLESIIRDTSKGFRTGERYSPGDLRTYGCTSFKDLKSKIRKLANAWRGVIRIRWHDNHREGRIEVQYFAEEYLPKKETPDQN
ncbi:hypothetical protein HY630_02440 [Candidatus Uhrbacteria bacterium]|nr:hypothetical protein [Candidatus Uhrbacteria bacterium]